MADNKDMTYEEILADMEKTDKEEKGFFHNLKEQGGLLGWIDSKINPGYDEKNLAELAVGFDPKPVDLARSTFKAGADIAGDYLAGKAAGAALKMAGTVNGKPKPTELLKDNPFIKANKHAYDPGFDPKIAKQIALKNSYMKAAKKAEAAGDAERALRMRKLSREAGNTANKLISKKSLYITDRDVTNMLGDRTRRLSREDGHGLWANISKKLLGPDATSGQVRTSVNKFKDAAERSGKVGHATGTVAAAVGAGNKIDNLKDEIEGAPERDNLGTKMLSGYRQYLINEGRDQIDVDLTKQYLDTFMKYNTTLNRNTYGNDEFFDEYLKMRDKDDEDYLDWLLSKDTQKALQYIEDKEGLVEYAKYQDNPIFGDIQEGLGIEGTGRF